ncbi:hypothetical protein RM697_10135 [Ichthyenterobacterium sp. W332]|uniref:Uncharacterized protein n=1 Tax=Microcosmobacter mediterraneus TaxID=3075607 RepID=A0ABU2YLI4_9FLAO|nr:hypothetical protein [Ichthyenterobacterium sp. W332]MDT0559008.1 hypothetical protein [Ichthyenterobacterium sp. W332]
MRNVFKIAMFYFLCIGVLQAQNIEGKIDKNSVTYESVSLSVTVDSLEEINETFQMEDLKSLLKDIGTNETLSFKIICNGELMSNGVKSYMSYKVSGNSDEQEKFIKSVEKIIQSAKNYYIKN